jgi:hypothetical protein
LLDLGLNKVMAIQWVENAGCRVSLPHFLSRFFRTNLMQVMDELDIHLSEVRNPHTLVAILGNQPKYIVWVIQRLACDPGVSLRGEHVTFLSFLHYLVAVSQHHVPPLLYHGCICGRAVLCPKKQVCTCEWSDLCSHIDEAGTKLPDDKDWMNERKLYFVTG